MAGKTTSGGLRKRRVHRFVQIPSATIRDKELSFRARGVLAYLLDMPDGWDVKSEVVAREGKEGREAIRTAFHELGARGYYRLERRQMLDGTFGMGTAISEEPVAQWASDYAEYDGKAVPCVQQADGSFRIKHKDGTLTDDGFPAAAVDGSPEPPDDDPSGGQNTGDGFSGPGFPGSGAPGPGAPDSGAPDSGSSGALSSTQTEDRDTEEDFSSAPLRDSDATSNLKRGSDQIEERNAGRDDVTRLCEHLVQRIVDNGSKAPTITAKWRDAARLLLDADKRTEKQVHTAIDWCQDNEFWRANILSMPTLREKYDQLRLQAQRERDAGQSAGMRRGGHDDVATWGDPPADSTAADAMTEAEAAAVFRRQPPATGAVG